MTQNQIAYQQAMETVRHNQESEAIAHKEWKTKDQRLDFDIMRYPYEYELEHREQNLKTWRELIKGIFKVIGGL